MPKAPVHLHMPTNGVRDDFLAVMNEFLELKTVRFSEFSEIWRSKKMSYLCAGRHSDREAREFLERAFLIALDFFLPPYQFQVRVGGLYLLYSLYMTQPIVPGVKVRLTQGQWRETMRFQQDAAQQNHLDVVYVFNKMLQEQAFHFCFTALEISSRSHHHETKSSGVNLAEEMKEDRRDIDGLFNYEAMEQLSYLLDHYQQMKVNLAGPEATQPDKSLDVVQGKMVEDLVIMLQSFKTRVGNIQKHGKAEPETDKNQGEQEQSGETTGSRRQALKARAFSEIKKGGARSTFVISVEKDAPSIEESQEQASLDCQIEDPEITNSNSFTKGARTLSCLEADQQINGTDVISVEVYSKSGSGVAFESSAMHEGKKMNLKETHRKGSNLISHEFQSDKVDASCYLSCAGGRGTKVALPVFEDVVVKSESKSKNLETSDSQGAQSVSNDSPPSGSKDQTSEKPNKKRNEKQPKILDSATTESHEMGSRQQSKKVNSGNRTNKKKGKRGKTESALTTEELPKKQSRDVSDEGPIDDKPKRPYDSESSTSKGGKKAGVTKRTESQNLTQSSDEQDSHSLSNELNKVHGQRKVSRKNPKTPVIIKAPKSPSAQASLQQIDFQSEGENFESPRKRIRVNEHEVTATDEEREENDSRGKGISNHSTKKVAVRRPITENQRAIELEGKSSYETSSKRKRSLRESDEHSLNVSVREEGLSPPKKITPSKFKRKCLEASPVKGIDTNSNLSKVDKRSLKKSPAKGNNTNSSLSKVKTTMKDSPVIVIGDKTKSKQTRQKGKLGASSVMTVKEVLVYKEPNKTTIFKERVASNGNTTSPSALPRSRKAQISSKQSIHQTGDMGGQQIMKNISPSKSETSEDQETGSCLAAVNLPGTSNKTSPWQASGNKMIVTSTSPKKTRKETMSGGLEIRYI